MIRSLWKHVVDSATANVDYETVNMNLTFVVNSTDSTAQCLNVTITDDTLVEGDEIFMVTLVVVTTGVGVTLGSNSTTILIIDNDGQFLLLLFCFCLSTFVLLIPHCPHSCHGITSYHSDYS